MLLRLLDREPDFRAPETALWVQLAPAFAERRLRTGDTAFLQGEAFRHLHAVRHGSFKITVLHADGREQVSQFCYPGDLMGLDGLGRGIHASTAVALEDSGVAPVPLTSLRDTATRSKLWHEVLCCHMGQEIIREHAQMLLLGTAGSYARLATFLIEVSDRMRSCGYSPVEFHMHMSRADIGSYLGLRLETVSRMLSTLQQQGVLTVNKRHIVIRSPRILQKLRDHVDVPSSPSLPGPPRANGMTDIRRPASRCAAQSPERLAPA